MEPDEIERIKTEAYKKGLEQGKLDYHEQIKKLKKESEEVALLRTEWQTMVKMVQQHYLVAHDQDLKVLNDDGIFSFTNEPKLSVPADMDAFQEELARLVKMGRDFEIMLKGINDHAVLKGCWDKLVMTFKLIEQ
jgi:hypothetical protein